MTEQTRQALADLLWSNAAKPSCQAGLLERCMCQKCVTERALAALATPEGATALEAVRAFMQRHTQSNVDRMGLDDLHAAVDALATPEGAAGSVSQIEAVRAELLAALICHPNATRPLIEEALNLLESTPVAPAEPQGQAEPKPQAQVGKVIAYRATKTGALFDADHAEALWPDPADRMSERNQLRSLVYATTPEPREPASKPDARLHAREAAQAQGGQAATLTDKESGCLACVTCGRPAEALQSVSTWVRTLERRPEPGDLICKRWDHNRAVWAGFYRGTEKGSSFDEWCLLSPIAALQATEQ